MDEIDRILGADDSLAPSADFTARVMTAVHTATDQELAMPWGRVAFGVAACAATAASITWFVSSTDALAAFTGAATVPGAEEAVLVATLSAATAQLFRVRTETDC
jgi:hypothetical protein